MPQGKDQLKSLRAAACRCQPFLPWKSPQGTGRGGGTEPDPICMLETVLRSLPACFLPASPLRGLCQGERRVTDRRPASPATPDPRRQAVGKRWGRQCHAFPVAQKNTHPSRDCAILQQGESPFPNWDFLLVTIAGSWHTEAGWPPSWGEAQLPGWEGQLVGLAPVPGGRTSPVLFSRTFLRIVASLA